MTRLRTRRAAGVLTVLVAVMTLMLAISPAGAITQHQPTPITVACGGTWHWVHNQTSATSGTLTAVFASAGTRQVANTPSNSTNLHYHITLASGDTLLSASDNVAGGRLVLSNVPVCATTTTTSTTTTSTTTTTTSTSLPTTTSSIP